MRLPWLKVSGNICRANPYSKQDCPFGHSPQWGHLFYERSSGSEAAQAGFGKQFRALVCTRLQKEQDYQSRLGSDKGSVQFIIATHCVIKYFNNQCWQTLTNCPQKPCQYQCACVRSAIPGRSLWSTTELFGHFSVVVIWIYRVLVGKPEGKKPLGRPRRRWEDNIKMDL